ncbi:hypothetical protein F4803DRAFT_212892 [Xylaria telfairii]|nr:hypothetical protein F4803DRAFT_212892 [Xylaria telfairii]
MGRVGRDGLSLVRLGCFAIGVVASTGIDRSAPRAGCYTKMLLRCSAGPGGWMPCSAAQQQHQRSTLPLRYSTSTTPPPKPYRPYQCCTLSGSLVPVRLGAGGPGQSEPGLCKVPPARADQEGTVVHGVMRRYGWMSSWLGRQA